MLTLMTDLATLTGIARNAARSVLSETQLVDVRAEEIIDSTGREALQFLVVLRPMPLRELKKLPYIATDRAIARVVEGTGEERFAFVHYATTDDLADDGNPES